MTARKLALNPNYIAIIENAAMLHDIGKLTVDQGLIHKPGRLSDAEYKVVQEHPMMSARIVGFDMPDLAYMILHHHERFDGSGYPSGLVGENIPLGSRIISVVDAFDAICSTRPYRNAQPHKIALDILREESGITLDAVVVRAFLSAYTDRRIGIFISGAFTALYLGRSWAESAYVLHVAVISKIHLCWDEDVE
jgi:HD-GYP domain-containing protein (c-di-GMP phosphodiesterase class II)